MLKSSVTVWMLAFSLNASAGHESHGDGTFGAYGYLKVLMETSMDLRASSNEWKAETKKLLSAHTWSCRVRVETDREWFARLFLVGREDDCLVFINHQAWHEAYSYENRWKGYCKVLLENEDEKLIEEACRDAWGKVGNWRSTNF